MKRNKLFYIGKRNNPQISKPYYKDYGQLNKREASKKENCIYGSMILTCYDTEEEYIKAKEKLKNEGFTLM